MVGTFNWPSLIYRCFASKSKVIHCNRNGFQKLTTKKKIDVILRAYKNFFRIYINDIIIFSYILENSFHIHIPIFNNSFRMKLIYRLQILF